MRQLYGHDIGERTVMTELNNAKVVLSALSQHNFYQTSG